METRHSLDIHDRLVSSFVVLVVVMVVVMVVVIFISDIHPLSLTSWCSDVDMNIDRLISG